LCIKDRQALLGRFVASYGKSRGKKGVEGGIIVKDTEDDITEFTRTSANGSHMIFPLRTLAKIEIRDDGIAARS